MASISIIGILGWGNLSGPCQAPLDRLRPLGEVCGRFFLYEGFISKWVQHGPITGGFSHGEHRQLS